MLDTRPKDPIELPDGVPGLPSATPHATPSQTPPSILPTQEPTSSLAAEESPVVAAQPVQSPPAPRETATKWVADSAGPRPTPTPSTTVSVAPEAAPGPPVGDGYLALMTVLIVFAIVATGIAGVFGMAHGFARPSVEPLSVEPAGVPAELDPAAQRRFYWEVYADVMADLGGISQPPRKQ